MRTEVTIISSVVFNSNANKYLNFPLRNSIRMSFWLDIRRGSTFSEFHFDSIIEEINHEYFARVLLPNTSMTLGLKVGDKFGFGARFACVGEGVVTGIVEQGSQNFSN